jgi:hypothetical protein
MALTYVQIGSTVTVGSGGTSAIEFTSIPSTYTDLIVSTSIRTSRNTTFQGNMKVQFNSSTSNYSGRFLRGNEIYVETYNPTAIEFGAPTAYGTANTFGNAAIYIPNYAGSTYKSVSIDSVIEYNNVNQFNYLMAGLWSDTSAITSIKIFTSDAGFNIEQYSTASLYGIKNS